jgi:hypothetical protein
MGKGLRLRELRWRGHSRGRLQQFQCHKFVIMTRLKCIINHLTRDLRRNNSCDICNVSNNGGDVAGIFSNSNPHPLPWFRKNFSRELHK